MHDAAMIERFLRAVDQDFPVPLSRKQDLHAFSLKLAAQATLCAVEEQGEIAALAAGYTDNMIENRAYMSILATLPSARGKGYAEQVVRSFLRIARERGASAVHLYAVADNVPAMKLYAKLGFVRWDMPGEPRPGDAHLIYYFD